MPMAQTVTFQNPPTTIVYRETNITTLETRQAYKLITKLPTSPWAGAVGNCFLLEQDRADDIVPSEWPLPILRGWRLEGYNPCMITIFVQQMGNIPWQAWRDRQEALVVGPETAIDKLLEALELEGLI